MEINEYYIYDATHASWLGTDGVSWGSFVQAAAYTDMRLAEKERERVTKRDLVTYTLGWVQ